MADVQILEVPSTIAHGFYPFIQKHVRSVLKFIRGEYDESYLKNGLRDGSLILLIAAQEPKLLGMVILSVEDYPRMRILRVLQVAGRAKKSWAVPMHDYIESVARRLKCYRIEGTGRKGWAAEAKRFGFTPYHVTYIKDIAYGNERI